MRISGSLRVLPAVIAASAILSACGTGASTASPAALQGPAPSPAARAPTGGAAAADAISAASQAPATPTAPPTASTSSPAAKLPAAKLPAAGNPNGHAYVPPTARAVNTSHPAHVIGHGTPASCTSAAVVRAVALGGVITFNCGPAPVTIVMRATAKVVNTSRRVVVDGGGKVILSGAGKRRILYLNTCDPKQVWTTSHCQDQATPQLTVQNLTFTGGNATGHDIYGGSGGAIYAEGGELTVVNSRFIDNRCYATGPDLGGAAIRAFEQWPGRPVYIVHSTFTGGWCSNGGALSSIAVSWTVLNSWLARNHATGWGANPASAGAPGGGSGGAIYNDGDNYSLTIAGTILRNNYAREGGGAIFYVCDAVCGHAYLRIRSSLLHHNPSAGFFTQGFPGIFFHGSGAPIVVNSRLG